MFYRLIPQAEFKPFRKFFQNRRNCTQGEAEQSNQPEADDAANCLPWLIRGPGYCCRSSYLKLNLLPCLCCFISWFASPHPKLRRFAVVPPKEETGKRTCFALLFLSHRSCLLVMLVRRIAVVAPIPLVLRFFIPSSAFPVAHIAIGRRTTRCNGVAIGVF